MSEFKVTKLKLKVKRERLVTPKLTLYDWIRYEVHMTNHWYVKVRGFCLQTTPSSAKDGCPSYIQQQHWSISVDVRTPCLMTVSILIRDYRSKLIMPLSPGLGTPHLNPFSQLNANNSCSSIRRDSHGNFTEVSSAWKPSVRPAYSCITPLAPNSSSAAPSAQGIITSWPD